MQQQNPQPLWNVEQVAQFLGRSPAAIYQMTARRQLPYVKLGRRLAFLPERIQKWIEDHEKQESFSTKE